MARAEIDARHVMYERYGFRLVADRFVERLEDGREALVGGATMEAG